MSDQIPQDIEDLVAALSGAVPYLPGVEELASALMTKASALAAIARQSRRHHSDLATAITVGDPQAIIAAAIRGAKDAGMLDARVSDLEALAVQMGAFREGAAGQALDAVVVLIPAPPEEPEGDDQEEGSEE